MGAAQEWDEMVKPWRAVAERRGFRLLDRQVDLIRGGHRCVDFLASGPTFLDLYGELGEVNGFWHATATTWIDTPDSRFSLSTAGEMQPPPRPPGAAGFFAKVVVRLMHKLAPAAVPVAMRAPDDLGLVIDRHLRELMAVAGKPVLFEGDPLEARFRQQERDEASA
ncbi:MAG: hypothetical protein LC689_05855 [Myxococcales bacterium]|nr:hypothetical protein [Myxococcales bacterium]